MTRHKEAVQQKQSLNLCPHPIAILGQLCFAQRPYKPTATARPMSAYRCLP